MHNFAPTQLPAQRGISLVGMLFSMGVLVLLAILAAKVVPTVIEYNSVKRAIVAAKTGASTANEIKLAFDRQAEVGYITSISSKDLTIDANGGDVIVSFSYQKKIPLFGPASLLLEYQGTTATNGVIAKKPE